MAEAAIIREQPIVQCNKGRWLRRVEVQIRVFQSQKGRGKFHAAQTKVRAVRDVFFSRS